MKHTSYNDDDDDDVYARLVSDSQCDSSHDGIQNAPALRVDIAAVDVHHMATASAASGVVAVVLVSEAASAAETFLAAFAGVHRAAEVVAGVASGAASVASGIVAGVLV